MVQLFDSVSSHSPLRLFAAMLRSVLRKRIRSRSHESQLEKPQIVHHVADFQFGRMGQCGQPVRLASVPDFRFEVSVDFAGRSRRVFRVLLQTERNGFPHVSVSAQRAGNPASHRLDSFLYQQADHFGLLPMQSALQADEAVDPKQADASA